MVYNYTIPRGKISAMDSSPGPSYVLLPPLVGRQNHDPRSVHSRGPAYPLGDRHKYADVDESLPGPCYLPDSKVHRTGRDGAPHHTVTGRVREPQWFSPPGPGTYYPEHCTKKVKHTEPSYSLGCRIKQSETSNNPVPPNMYTAPPMLGKTPIGPKRQAPSYTMSGRYKTGQIDELPGPSSYTVPDVSLVRRSPPKHSVTGRVQPPPDDSARKPGPAAYSSERVWGHKRESPRFSFGLRHSQYSSTLVTSADNAL